MGGPARSASISGRSSSTPTAQLRIWIIRVSWSCCGGLGSRWLSRGGLGSSRPLSIGRICRCLGATTLPASMIRRSWNSAN
jgi:hypothetical protein